MLRGKKRCGLNPRGGKALKSEGKEEKEREKTRANVFSQGFLPKAKRDHFFSKGFFLRKKSFRR